MRRWRGWVLVLAAAGCHAPPKVAPRPAVPTAPHVAVDLPFTNPTVPVLDGKGLPQPTPRTVAGPDGSSFRRLTEGDCLLLAAATAPAANMLDDENRVPPAAAACPTADAIRRSVRYHAALELRNRAAADALERFSQLSDAAARANLLRQAFPILDALAARAKAARGADVRFPLDPADLARQRSQLETQLELAELGSRLLTIDLKHRLGLPAVPADERLWPVGEFAVDPTPADPESAATAALADRPELRGLRALYHGLTPELLPDARDLLRAGNPLLGSMATGPAARVPWLFRRAIRKSGADQTAAAELEVRKQQLFDLITERERMIADEARAAALSLNALTVRAALAVDRLRGWDEKLAGAVKKREAAQPGAEFEEPQVRLEWLKARAEVVAEVAAWHQARIRLRAAQGWLAWDALGTPR